MGLLQIEKSEWKLDCFGLFIEDFNRSSGSSIYFYPDIVEFSNNLYLDVVSPISISQYFFVKGLKPHSQKLRKERFLSFEISRNKLSKLEMFVICAVQSQY